MDPEPRTHQGGLRRGQQDPSEFPTEARRQEAIKAVGELIDSRDVSTVGITFNADNTCTIINPPMRNVTGTWKINPAGGVEISAENTPFAQPMEFRSGELHMMQGGLPMMVWVKGTPKAPPADAEPPKAP